MKLIGLKMN